MLATAEACTTTSTRYFSGWDSTWGSNHRKENITMKKFLSLGFAFCLVLFMTTVSSAQGKGGGHGQGHAPEASHGSDHDKNSDHDKTHAGTEAREGQKETNFEERIE